MTVQYVKEIVLGTEGDEDSTAALNPKQISDQLVQIDTDDLYDVVNLLQKDLQTKTTAHGGSEKVT
jgi:hypothetical protein